MNRIAIQWFSLGFLFCFTFAGNSALGDEPQTKIPKGWKQGSAALEKLPPSPGPDCCGMQWMHEMSFNTRSNAPGGRVFLNSLPVVEVNPSKLSAETPKTLPEGSQADVIVIKKEGSIRVSVQGFEAGMIRVGKASPVAIGRQSDGGAVDMCGAKAPQGLMPIIHYEAIRRIDTKGTLLFVWGNGFLDASTCQVSIVERYEARPKHVAGGIVFAFQTNCQACREGERSVLHVLTPQLTKRLEVDVPFEHQSLVLGPGKSGAFEGLSSLKDPFSKSKGNPAYRTWGMQDWYEFVNVQCKQDSVWCAKHVRLEVSQGMGETAPTIFVAGGRLGLE